MRRSAERMTTVVAAGLLLFAAEGCVATRGWVREQLNPMDARLNDVDAKLANLKLERRLVIDMNHGATFSSGSAVLGKRARTEIDRFFKELAETNGTLGGDAGDRVFVVAGHTDATGNADENYELAQRRAERVAGYVLSHEPVEPFQVRAVSYGPSKPVASNRTVAGRQKNRRIEILVYQEQVSPWEKMLTALQ